MLKVCPFVQANQKTRFSILMFFELLIKVYYRISVPRSLNLKSDFPYPPPPLAPWKGFRGQKNILFNFNFFKFLMEVYYRLLVLRSPNLKSDFPYPSPPPSTLKRAPGSKKHSLVIPFSDRKGYMAFNYAD